MSKSEDEPEGEALQLSPDEGADARRRTLSPAAPQDVDDILRTLAASESEMPAVPPPVRGQPGQRPPPSQVPASEARSTKSLPRDTASLPRNSGLRHEAAPSAVHGIRTMPRNHAAEGKSHVSKDFRTARKPSPAPSPAPTPTSPMMHGKSLANVKMQRRQQRELQMRSELERRSPCLHSPDRSASGTVAAGSSKSKLEELEESICRQYPPQNGTSGLLQSQSDSALLSRRATAPSAPSAVQSSSGANNQRRGIREHTGRTVVSASAADHSNGIADFQRSKHQGRQSGGQPQGSAASHSHSGDEVSCEH